MYLDLINLSQLKRCLMYAGILLASLFVQNYIFSHISFFGVRPLFVPVFAVAVGIFQGGAWGGFLGLLAGLLCDSAFSANVVLFTVLFPVIGFFSGMLSQFFVNRKFFSYMFVCAAALLITGFCQMLRPMVILGMSPVAMLPTALLQTLWSLPFAAALFFPCRAVSEMKLR